MLRPSRPWPREFTTVELGHATHSLDASVVIGSAGGVLSVSVRSSRSAGPTVVAAMVGLWLCWGLSFPAIRVMVKTHLLVAVIARDDSPEFSA